MGTTRSDSRVPASELQTQLWLGEAVGGEAAAYTMPEVLRIDGDLGTAELRSTLRVLVERHEALRTTFELDEAGLWQRIHPECVAEPQWVGLTPGGDHEGEFRDRVAEAVAVPFALDRPPLWRCLVGGTGRVTYLALLCHHLIADGWSSRVLFDEWDRLLRGGSLDPAGPGYRVFAAAERRWSAGARGHREFWKRTLADAPARSALPAVRGRAPEAQRPANRLVLPVSPALVGELAAVARDLGVTPFAAHLGAFAVTLARHLGTSDVVLGVPAANRGEPGSERSVGLFTNPLPVRVRIAPGATLASVLTEAVEALFGAIEHERLPFSEVVRLAGVPRSGAETPLFQVIVDPRGADHPRPRFGGHPAAKLAVPHPVAKYALRVNVPDGPDDPVLIIDYDESEYDERYIRMIGEDHIALLTAVTTAPDAAALPAGGAPERRPATIHERFRLRAAAGPHRLAVVEADRWCTYGELDLRSDRIAAALGRRGVRRGDVVGLSLPRGIGFAEAALGVLKAGACYLPLDGEWPLARTSALLRDSGAATVVVDAPGDDGRFGALALDIGTARTAEPVEPLPAAGGEDLAYVIYTSGSTGRPKGVLIEHASVCRLTDPDQPFAVAPGDRVAHHASTAFDAAVLELWCPLLSGASVVVPSGRSPGPDQYADLFERATVALVVSGTFAELTRHPRSREALRRLRQLMIGGDVLDPAAVDRLGDPAGQVRWHLYGPTETTVVAACGPLAARSPRGSVPIGHATAGGSLAVLDADGTPAKPGHVGEIFVGGSGVARGYLGDPARTAERFVADPARPGRRRYATGDFGRLLPDGAVDFVERRDQQVKIRGVRIETGELEAALRAHAGVSSARVLVEDAGPGDRRLVAVVRPARDDHAELEEELRRWISDTLPAALRPHRLVLADAMPLTLNGKVDVAALTGGRVAPGPRDERLPAHVRRMAGLWERVLHRPAGTGDDFFRLGGDSLTALRLLVLVGAEFGVSAQPESLFRNSELEAFTAHVAALSPAVSPARQAARTPSPRPAELPLSPGQRRLWFLQRLSGAGADYNLPFALRFRGALDPDALRTAVGDVVARHESLRTRFPDHGGAPVQEIVAPAAATWPFTVVAAGEHELAGLVTDAARSPFDLAADLPLRVWLFRLGDLDHVLLLLLHHIAGDGWSIAPLVRDLAAAYAARGRGRAPGFTPLPVQYADYALRQQEVLRPQGPGEAQLAFWEKRLRELPTQIPLPVDHAGGPGREDRDHGGTVRFRLDEREYRHLRELAEAWGTTLFTLLHAALAALLTRLGAGTDIPVGTPVAARTDPAFDDVVGFFVNTVVLRASTADDPRFTDLVARVHSANLDAYAHQDVPFERVVEHLNPPRSPGVHPLFRVLLVSRDVPPPRLGFPGLTVTEEPVETRAVKFDLTFTAGVDGHELSGSVQYRSALFERATIERIVAQYRGVLTGFAADPGLRVSEVPLPRNEDSALSALGAAAPDQCLHTLFAEQAGRTPDRTAVSLGARSWTYRELERWATSIAGAVYSRCGAPEFRVAILLPRSPAQIAATLGVLLAGGTCVPLDPGFPAERLSTMVRTSEATLLLTEPGIALPAVEPGIEIVHIGQCADDPRRPPLVPCLPSNLAAIYFTSGSTGRPKAIAATHRGALNYLAFLHREFELGEDDVVLGTASPAFDASVKDLFGPLLTGAHLVLLPDEDGKDPDAILTLAAAAQATALLSVVPSLLTALARAAHHTCPEGLPRLRRISVSGELLTGELAEAARALGPQVEFVHQYGPTEGTVTTTFHRVADPPPAGPVPIGRPIPDMRCHVLDHRLNPVPTGVVGELYLAGPGLARGYFGDAAATAAAFLPDPWGPPGERMYRTGDLARRRNDGSLEFHGRTDDQVKVRGVRVELGEVAVTLGRHPAVAVAAADVRDTGTGPELVGYLVLEDAACPISDVRSFAAGLLPAQLVPSRYVVLDRLPLTRNGKIDRKRLPDPASNGLPGPRAIPRTGEELHLARVWQQVLGVQVDARDDFFDLGGHSLKAAELIDLVNREFDVRLPLSSIFHAPTVERMAALMPAAHRGSPTLAVPLTTGPGTAPPLFLVHPQSGEVACYHPLARELGRPGPVFGLEAVGSGTDGEPLRTVGEMAGRYLTDIRKIQPAGPYFIAGWSFGGNVAFEIALRLEREGEEIGFVAAIDSQAYGGGHSASESPPVPEPDEVTFARYLGLDAEALLLLGESRRLPILAEAATSLGLLPQRDSAGALRRMISVFTANARAAAEYRPADRLRSGVHLFLADDPGAAPRRPVDVAAWRQRTHGELVLGRVPGDHMTMVRPPHVRALAAEIRTRLSPSRPRR